MSVSKDQFLDAAYDGKIDTVRQFLAEGGDVNCINEQKRTALHRAAIMGRSEIIKLLLDHGADKTLKDACGDMPEKDARTAGKHETLEILLHYKAKWLAAEAEDGWALLASDRVAHVQTEEKLRIRMTEIFNFATKQYHVITQNLTTKAEALFSSSFEKLRNDHLIGIAQNELQNLGGKIKPDDIEGAVPRNKKYLPTDRGNE